MISHDSRPPPEGVDRNDYARNYIKKIQQEVSYILKEAKKGKA